MPPAPPWPRPRGTSGATSQNTRSKGIESAPPPHTSTRKSSHDVRHHLRVCACLRLRGYPRLGRRAPPRRGPRAHRLRPREVGQARAHPPSRTRRETRGPRRRRGPRSRRPRAPGEVRHHRVRDPRSRRRARSRRRGRLADPRNARFIRKHQRSALPTRASRFSSVTCAARDATRSAGRAVPRPGEPERPSKDSL